MVIYLTKSQSIHTAFVQNRGDGNCLSRILRAEIWVGDDMTPYAHQLPSPDLQQAFTYVYDSGFFELELENDDELYKGSVVALKRLYQPELEAQNDLSY